MSPYTQAHRTIRVRTALGPDRLMLAGFTGVEAISAPFRYTLDLFSEDSDVDASALLRTPATITLDLEDGGERHIHGLISRFTERGRSEDLTAYQAEISPWISFLDLSHDCRIFQNMTVPEILEEVFNEQGYSDYRLRCAASYPQREYCVQYRESHLDFVSRLMEEEGIFYYFEHGEDSHVLVLADSNRQVDPCPDVPTISMRLASSDEGESVTAFTREHAVHPGKVTLKSYDFEQPSLNLESSIPGIREEDEEVYDYAGGFTSVDEGERYARIRIEAAEALHQTARGEGTYRGMRSGSRVDLEGHHRSDANQSYLLLQVEHTVTTEGFRTSQIARTEYLNRFVAIPSSVPFRPPQRTPKPVVRGSQTARVVGKSGEEIWVDSHGRVKVHFPWDRVGSQDENSSCWVRVSTSWAGKGWGAIQLPRIGQEVIVDFLEGDPDRPIITGRVYNAEQVPPYELPDGQAKSGVKSRSTKEGGTDAFNELRFDDTIDEEEIYLHAEKDLNTVVENNETRKVGFEKKDSGDQTVEIFNNQILKVGAGGGNADAGSQTVEIYGDQTVTLKTGNQTITIEKGNRSVTLDEGNEQIKLTMGSRTVTLDQGDDSLTIKTGNLTTKLQAGNATLELDMGNVTTKAKMGKISKEAMQEIELKVGQNSIKIDQMGVEIKGMMVKIEGQMQTQLKGMMTEVNGTAMTQVKGAITMIG